jgi:fructuronate reductase/mannitol 2-dehydrogenase
LRGVDEQGQAIVLQDGRAEELRKLANRGQTDPRPLLSVRRVFGDLVENVSWVGELTATLRKLDASGAQVCVHQA